MEARLGIEPRLSALQADAFPLGYRALAGLCGTGVPPVTAHGQDAHATSRLGYCRAALLGLSVVKEQ